MFKFATVGNNGEQFIGVGLEEGNLIRLKQNKPIKIEYSQLELPWPGGIVICVPSAEAELVESRMPEEWSMLKIDDETMAILRASRLIQLKASNSLQANAISYKLLLFWAKDSEGMRKMASNFIGKDTKDLSPEISDGQHRTKMGYHA